MELLNRIMTLYKASGWLTMNASERKLPWAKMLCAICVFTVPVYLEDGKKCFNGKGMHCCEQGHRFCFYFVVVFKSHSVASVDPGVLAHLETPTGCVVSCA